MRDLLHRGVRVVGVDCFPTNPGFRSCYGKSYLCPNPDRQPDEWLAFMRKLARELGGKPVIIPAADIFVSALGDHAAALESDYRFSRDSVVLQAALATKEQQYALAAKAGFPCPRTEYVQSQQELAAFCAAARFPCLMKPRSQREWESLPQEHPLCGKKLATATTAAELIDLYGRVAALRPQAVVQEIIAGGDDAKYCYLSVYGTNRERLGYCVVQEFRAHPIEFGSASVVQPIIDPEIEELCDRFLRSLGYVGLCEIEVKRDARDGQVRLIEVNPRFSGTGDCSIYTGLEVGWLHYLDLIGQPVSPVKATRLNFRHITIQRDAPAFGQYLDAGLTTWGQWWSVYRPPVEFFDFDLRDWRVTGETLYRALRALVGGILRHWKLRR
jgi:D-aspartate ligase